MTKGDLIKGILELGEELKTAEGMGALVDINEMELLVDKYTSSINSEIESLQSQLAKSEAEVEFYKKSMNNLAEDFKDIENRLRGHLSAETKLRVKLQADKHELLEALGQAINTTIDSSFYVKANQLINKHGQV